MKEFAKESYCVLRPGRFFAVLVGDTRKHRYHVPIVFKVMQAFLDVGFILREDVMKYQWRTKSTREKWEGLSKVAEECWVNVDKERKKGYYTDFLLLIYEHLFIFRKPENEEEKKQFKLSIKWWDEQSLTKKFQRTQEPQLTQTAAKVEGIETRLNPYGFIYIPKSALSSLPFKPGDRLHLEVDKANKRVILTPT